MGQSEIKLTGSKNIKKVIFKCEKRERTVIPSLLRFHQKLKISPSHRVAISLSVLTIIFHYSSSRKQIGELYMHQYAGRLKKKKIGNEFTAQLRAPSGFCKLQSRENEEHFLLLQCTI